MWCCSVSQTPCNVVLFCASDSMPQAGGREELCPDRAGDANAGPLAALWGRSHHTAPGELRAVWKTSHDPR